MHEMIKKAERFAIDAHMSIGQKRKYTNEPYHVHPARVASILSSVISDPEMIAAAWLHDVLEDVAPSNPMYNESAIKKLLGQRVLNLVLEVTDVSKPEDGNRAIRKALDRAHLAEASADGMSIKLADIIDNVTDIEDHDQHFSRVFKREVRLLLPHLQKGDAQLFQQVSHLLLS